MTAVSAVNMFSLRPGVSAAQFEQFSRELDRPTCLAFDVVQNFEVYLVDADIASGVDVIEVLTVSSWPEWEKLRDDAPELRPVVARFEELVEPSSVTTYFTRYSPLAQEN